MPSLTFFSKTTISSITSRGAEFRKREKDYRAEDMDDVDEL